MLTRAADGMENTNCKSYTFTLALSPTDLSTAQQKKVSFRQRRIFSNPKVIRTKKLVALLARPHRAAVRKMLEGAMAIRLEATYFFPYPKGTAKKCLIDALPKVNGADCDNINKAPCDALGYDYGHGANLWDDDRAISTLVIRKRYTTSSPRIVFTVSPDETPPLSP